MSRHAFVEGNVVIPADLEKASLYDWIVYWVKQWKGPKGGKDNTSTAVHPAVLTMLESCEERNRYIKQFVPGGNVKVWSGQIEIQRNQFYVFKVCDHLGD